MSDCQTYQQLIMIMAGVIVLLVIIIFRTRRKRKRQAVDLERRVHERTIELKKYVESLQVSQAERSFLLDGISKRINACLATMKGLGGIALTYENVPPELVKNIDVTADILGDILQQIAHEKKL